jgi:hypothetical protein
MEEEALLVVGYVDELAIFVQIMAKLTVHSHFSS